jgi:hypothetical protein
MAPRHFPPPWSVEDIGAAFVVKDSGGQKLAYIYYEEEPGRRSAAKPLTACSLWNEYHSKFERLDDLLG